MRTRCDAYGNLQSGCAIISGCELGAISEAMSSSGRRLKSFASSPKILSVALERYRQGELQGGHRDSAPIVNHLLHDFTRFAKYLLVSAQFGNLYPVMRLNDIGKVVCRLLQMSSGPCRRWRCWRRDPSDACVAQAMV